MIENILILDTETKGLKPEPNGVLEVGAILYNLPSKSIICEAATLFKQTSNPAEHINHISVSSLLNVDCVIETLATNMLVRMIKHADAVIAHNASFDRSWLEASGDFYAASKKAKWICSYKQLNWPSSSQGLKLKNIAEAMGIPYIDAHRSLPDCHILLNCLLKLSDFETQLNNLTK